MPGECEAEREVAGTEHRRSKSRSRSGRISRILIVPQSGMESHWQGHSQRSDMRWLTGLTTEKEGMIFFLALYNKLFHIHDNLEKLFFVFSPLPPISDLDYPVSSPRSSLDFSNRSYILASSMSGNRILLPSGMPPETIFWILPDISRAIFKPL